MICAAMNARSLLLAMILFMGGCATLPQGAVLPESLPADWESRRSVLQQWPRFDVQGRVAVANGAEGFTAALHWAQRARDASVELQGPFGMGGLRLRLTDGRFANESARVELEQQLGFVLPIESLRYWMLGVPDPARAVEEQRDGSVERLVSLRQEGWQVSFTSYGPVAGVDYDLPQRIEATREGVRVRLLIERWGAASHSGAGG